MVDYTVILDCDDPAFVAPRDRVGWTHDHWLSCAEYPDGKLQTGRQSERGFWLGYEDDTEHCNEYVRDNKSLRQGHLLCERYWRLDQAQLRQKLQRLEEFTEHMARALPIMKRNDPGGYWQLTVSETKDLLLNLSPTMDEEDLVDIMRSLHFPRNERLQLTIEGTTYKVAFCTRDLCPRVGPRPSSSLHYPYATIASMHFTLPSTEEVDIPFMHVGRVVRLGVSSEPTPYCVVQDCEAGMDFYAVHSGTEFDDDFLEGKSGSLEAAYQRRSPLLHLGNILAGGDVQLVDFKLPSRVTFTPVPCPEECRHTR